MNLCRPDNRKSCVACCGVYNVPDATRPTLERRLTVHTELFGSADRTVEGMALFENQVRDMEKLTPIEEMIHVCEFCGFVDIHRKCPGCMLHPESPGNRGTDFRGLCHYGSMACKSFFCPSWELIPNSYFNILNEAIDDWHLWGLVITDVHFVSALFGILEGTLGKPLETKRLLTGKSLGIFQQIIGWKNVWPYGKNSLKRINRYHITEKHAFHNNNLGVCSQVFLDCLSYTFDLAEVGGGHAYIDDFLRELQSAYKKNPG